MFGSKNTGLSIVIPAFNEEKRLPASMDKIISYLAKKAIKNWEIIVVDDCSQDSTPGIVRKYSSRFKGIRLERNEQNMGKGYSVRKGMLLAKKGIVLFSDADLSTPIEELGKFLDYLNAHDCDIIIASRSLKESDIRVKQPFHRVLLGRAFRLLVVLLAGVAFTDTQCGFKLFRKKAAKQIFRLQTFNRFSFDVEALYIAKKKGYKVSELPVVWIDSRETKVSPVKDSAKMLCDILKIRLNGLRGIYNR